MTPPPLLRVARCPLRLLSCPPSPRCVVCLRLCLCVSPASALSWPLKPCPRSQRLPHSPFAVSTLFFLPLPPFFITLVAALPPQKSSRPCRTSSFPCRFLNSTFRLLNSRLQYTREGLSTPLISPLLFSTPRSLNLERLFSCPPARLRCPIRTTLFPLLFQSTSWAPRLPALAR